MRFCHFMLNITSDSSFLIGKKIFRVKKYSPCLGIKNRRYLSKTVIEIIFYSQYSSVDSGGKHNLCDSRDKNQMCLHFWNMVDNVLQVTTEVHFMK